MANESYSNNPVSPNIQNLLGYYSPREDSFRIVNKSIASWSFNGGIPSRVYDIKLWDATNNKSNVLPGDYAIVLDPLGEYVARPVITVEPADPSEFFDISDEPVTKIEYTITGATISGSSVTYTTSANHNFTTSTFVTISGISPSQFNATKAKVTAKTNNTFTITKSISGSYSSGGKVYAQAKFNSNIVIKYLNSSGLEADYIIETYIGDDGYPANYIEVIREDWSNKYLGTSGWILSSSGNSIFNNVAVRGEINATSGNFTGNVKVDSGGKIYVGSSPTSGQRVVISDTGITGVDNSGITVFNLPATGTIAPTIANFEVSETKITGEGANAYFIAGTTGASANNVIVRGDKTGGQAAAIYNTISGTATTATSGNGFYIDDTGKFRFAQGSNVISGSEGNLSVTGQINATSGYIGGSSSGWLINSNRLTNDAETYGAGLIATSAPILKRNLAQNPDLSYSTETNAYSNDITGYQSINDIGTFNNNRSEVGFASAPFGFTLGSIILNGSANRTSTFTGTAGSSAITCSFDGETSTLYPGMFVFGTGIAAGAKINSIFGNVVFLNLVNTGTVSGTVTLLNPYTFTKPATGTSGQSTITVSPNNFGIVAGMRVTGTGIRAGVTVVSIASNVITLSGTNTGTVSGNATFFIEDTPIVNHFGGFEFDNARVPYTFTAQNYVASAYFYIPSTSSSLAGRTITLSVDSGATWTNGTATAATLVSGSWVRASTIITMTAPGAGAPNIVAKLSGALNSTTDYKQILTANWMISEGSSLQSYFDENFPMGVNVGGYAIEYEKAFYSGTTYTNSGNASLQLGHGGNIYAVTGKIGGLNVNSNRLYATNGNGDFVVGDIGTIGDYPEYGLRIDLENYWSQTQLKHEKKYPSTILGSLLPIFRIETSGSYLGDSSNPLGTVSEFNSVFSNGVAGAVISLSNIEDVDNGGLYRNVSGISSNYYNTSGTVTGSTYMAQFDATSWILGPNVKVAGNIDASGDLNSSASYTSNWFRSYGNSGWYSQTYGGGWYMIDTTWIRAYADKAVYTAGVMRADGGFQGNINGNAGSATTLAGRIQATSWTVGDGNGTGYNGDLIYPVNYDTLVLHASTRIASKTIRDNTTTTGANVNVSTGTLMSLQRVSSSYHIKHDIKPLSDYSSLSLTIPEEKVSGYGDVDLLKILDVVPVSFRSIASDDDQDLVRIGFIAQDIAEKVPEIATYDEDGEVTYFDINSIASALLAVCQNQETRIKDLELRLESLENN